MSGRATPDRVEVEIAGRRLTLSKLDKVLYPAVGFTKAHVIDYYTRVAPALLPHLEDAAGYGETAPFARAVAETLEAEHPRAVVSQMKKQLRTGKVFIDWSQNAPHKTTVCVYSLRARARPSVSTPVAWHEVEAALDAGDAGLLTFLSDEVVARVERLGDLFAPVLTLR